MNIKNQVEQKKRKLENVNKKLRKLQLQYEANRLHFAMLAYIALHKHEIDLKKFTMDDAAFIVLDYFEKCIIQAKNFLTFDELNTIFGFSVIFFYDTLTDNILKIKK